MTDDYGSQVVQGDPDLSALPWHQADNRFEAQIAESFVHAVQIYKRSMTLSDSAEVWILFVCEDDERNICDQKAIEVELQTKHGIKSMRKTLKDLQ